ncbi:large ribosomal subunit protein bL34m [Amyelois transitella]|uniref:large ribosomal subunit protein bL34m n=1 Tax=Amyelois transitella TaxID=680683 RepID=UPI00067D429A|nr:large ribosomal subunit protein bL34m [Amyelois transitella]XP_060804424.1 large ribosomal subunit protein bL34m [Amyelois transitella]
MSRLMTVLFQPLKLITHTVQQSISHIPSTTALVKSEYPLLTAVRTKVRCYFPRPNEVKRVRRHGWKTRMSTPNGRRVIMRRLLKGRFVLTH